MDVVEDIRKNGLNFRETKVQSWDFLRKIHKKFEFK